MKKTFKRAGVAVLSMAMLLSMGAVGAVSANAAGEGTIAVSAANGVTDATVKMYKVATRNNLGVWNWEPGFSSSVTFETINSSYTENSDDVKALASALARQVTNSTATVDTKTLSSSSTTATLTASSGVGYYLILVSTNDAGTLVQPILKQIKDGDAATASVKGSQITIDKSIEEIADATTNVATTKNTGVAAKGEKIEYKIATSIPQYDPGVDETSITDYVITDTPTTGIKINNTSVTTCNLAVTIGGVSKTAGTDYTYAATTDGFTITLSGTQVKANMGSQIEVTFDAELDTDAVVNAGNTNTAQVTYGNDYATGGGSVSKEDSVNVFTVNLEGVKVKQGDSSTKLSGAEFKLYKGSKTDGNLVATVTTAADGKVSFDRVTAGTYILEESHAPSGYKAIADQTIVISGTKSSNDYTGAFTADKVFTTFTSGVLSGNIEDPEAASLPGTGGMGTTLFTVGGAVIVLMAGFMFVFYMRKRRTEEE